MIYNRGHIDHEGFHFELSFDVYGKILEPETSENAEERISNLNPAVVQQIASDLGLTFTPEKEPGSEVCFANSRELRPEYRQTFALIDLLNYIYAVLHSPTYREKQEEFLKIGFMKVPYPTDVNIFWQLVKPGGELRQIHLLESPVVEKFIIQYLVEGSDVVGKVRYADNKVYINDKQYFNNVPEIAWNFYIGGYQPAQKWLKDRKGKQLEFEDILHYQKIIVTLTETNRLMREIDEVCKRYNVV